MANKHYHQGLPLPYKNVDPIRGLSRLSSDISYEDIALIKKVCPKKGVIMQVAQIFFSTLANHLRNNNLTYYTPENEQEFINIVNGITEYGRRTAVESPRETDTRNDGGGASEPCSKPKRSLKQRGDVETPADNKTGKGKVRSRAKSRQDQSIGE